VREWASKFRPEEGDKYGILSELHTLALAYSRVRKTSSNRSKEHGLCRGIDDIIEIAFSAKTDRHCNFKYALSLLATQTLSTLTLEPKKAIILQG
jgi:hypothetical protein